MSAQAVPILSACAYQTASSLVPAEAVETILSSQLDELEPRLTQHGYNVKSLAAQFHARPAEIRLFLRGALNEQRTSELTEQMRPAVLPL